MPLPSIDSRKLIRALARMPSLRLPIPARIVEVLLAARRRAARLRRGSVQIDGFTIPYLEGGRGETVVLLHGFGDSKDSFVDAVHPLLAHHRVVMPDLPGFGEATYDPSFDHRLAHLAAILGRFIAGLGAERVHLVGNSLGGALALRLAIDHPERFASLALIDAAGVEQPTPSPLQRKLDAGENPFVLGALEEYDAWIAFVMQRVPPMPWGVRRHLARAFLARAPIHAKVMDDLLRHEDDELTGELDRVRTPTLILWGSEDRLIDVSSAHVMQQRIPGAKLVVLHGVGHCPQYELPDRTGELLDAFAREHASTQR
ncbi:MAG: alpha/beta fold hydrolase [Deltaproteobacteria bacterium]|nr:alpha/beta fold hydrolase [Nannocystaceae bacterium]